MVSPVFLPADILLPQNACMTRWSVIACDQFSSQREYWERVDKFVGDAPSTLRLIVPEAYLDEIVPEESAREIVRTMRAYLGSGLFRTLPQSFVYVERTLASGAVRRGLVGMLDLEQYDFTPGASAPVRASERTIIERLPARVAVRRGAPLELPHIMALIDDAEGRVIEPLSEKTAQLEQVYEFELMEGGGTVRGWRVAGELAESVQRALHDLPARRGVRIVIGDGNHSLAAAKEMWDGIKPSLSESERRSHPARYALVELNNVYDPSIEFEAIHRIVFGADAQELLTEARQAFEAGEGESYAVRYVTPGGEGVLTLRAESIGGMIARLQAFLDDFVARRRCTIDYIHGEDAVSEMARRPGATGFILPAMRKDALFRTVEAGAVFPKKSFSIGHARDKRYYLEARRIEPAR